MTRPPEITPEKTLPQRAAELVRGALGSVRARPWCSLAAVSLGLFVATAAAGLRWTAVPDCHEAGCPDLGTIDRFRPPEAPHYYDRDGRLVGHLPGEVRLWLPLDSMPESLRAGIVAVEDRRFRDHSGIDIRGALRAAVTNAVSGGVREGASTLTMQLARNLWWPALGEYGRWRRKLVEARIARRLEERLTKDEILELYLNRVYLGSGVYGFGAAAHHYFGKRPAELSLAEIATLVGTVKTPERYHPRNHPERTRERRDVVLSVFETLGVAAASDIDAARAEAPVTTIDDTPVTQGRSYFAAAVSRDLRRLFPDPDSRSGLRVYTSLDLAAQASAEARLLEQIEAIEAGKYGRFRHEVGAGADMGRASGDSEYLQGAVLVLDVQTGEIRAAVGGRSFDHSEFDRAFLARRQPGSAFKPLVYAAALHDRAITLADPIDTSPFELVALDQRTGDEEEWKPADEQAVAEWLDARAALALSSNWAAIRVGNLVGPEKVARMADRLGIDSRVDRVPASFLGASVLRPVELVSAFAAIANGGGRVRPHVIRRVEDRSGRVLYEADISVAPALNPEVAFLVREALRGVVDGGTGFRARSSGYRGPAAGKTGTTNAWRDAWFVGFNGEVATGVWIGFDRPRTITRRAFGGTVAAPVWGAIMADLYGSGRDAPDLPPPPRGLRSVQVDGTTGLALSARCEPAEPRVEFFLVGTEPPPGCDVPAFVAPEASTSGLEAMSGGEAVGQSTGAAGSGR